MRLRSSIILFTLLLPIVQALSSTNASSSSSSSIMSTSSAALRSVKQILPAAPRHWVGDGFHVHPVFSNKAFTEELSPFLMFDYAVPEHFKPNNGSPRGVGQHPHRGFETVTIAFKGEVEHADSMGNRDVIKPGDVQWMTAGRGIIHQEFHSNEFSKKGGEFEMCQLWVNLPKKNKMTKPHYQAIVDKNIPIVDLKEASVDGEECSEDTVGSVRVIAGSFLGTKGPASTFSPVELWDATIQKKGTVVDLPFPDDYNCIVFVRRGEIDIIAEKGDAKRVESQGVALMKQEGGTIRIKTAQKNTSLLIMGGLPLNEPIAARGPFVMNTWDEINKANRDYMMGKFGK